MFSLAILDDGEAVSGELLAAALAQRPEVRIIGTADDRKEGIDFIKKHLPDIIVCDIDAPSANGFEIIEEIKRIPDYNPQIIILTQFDDFFHAKLAIQFHILSYLTKPVTAAEFLLSLSQAADECKNRQDFVCQKEEYIKNKRFDFVERLVHETLVPTPELEQAEKTLSLDLSSDSYLCVMAYIPEHEDVCAKEKAEVQKAFCSHFKCAMPSYFIDKRIYFLLPCSAEDYDKVIKGCKDLLKKFHKFRLYFCISDFGDSVLSIKTISRHAKECRRYAFSHKQSSVFVYDTINSYYNTSEFASAISKLKKFAADANIINISEWHRRIDDIKDMLTEMPYFDPDFIKTMVYNMMSSVIVGILASFTATEQEQPKDDMLWQTIVTAASLEELFLQCHNIADTFSNFMSVSIPQRNKALSEFMKNYITKNYMHSTTIASLSKLTYISPNYLSKIFLLENDISFKLYLKQYRMEKAREFILSKKYKIYQVSLLVGYKDVKKFRKAFMEYYGISPGNLLA